MKETCQRIENISESTTSRANRFQIDCNENAIAVLIFSFRRYQY